MLLKVLLVLYSRLITVVTITLTRNTLWYTVRFRFYNENSNLLIAIETKFKNLFLQTQHVCSEVTKIQIGLCPELSSCGT